MAASSQFVSVPLEPTAKMMAAAKDCRTSIGVWRAMVGAAQAEGEMGARNAVGPIRTIRRQMKARESDLPAEMLKPLPTTGVAHRNPSFWSDLEVRRLVIELHRQVTVQAALAEIAAHVGPDRTPSKSALARAWKRLDLTRKRSR